MSVQGQDNHLATVGTLHHELSEVPRLFFQQDNLLKNMIYDIIGDIHGQANKLENLLLKLGYVMVNGMYQHPARKAVFVGDLIDRGEQQRRVIEVVRTMVTHGHAFAVMGNHEYNAICYHTPKSATDYLRPHSKSKFRQHEFFLKEYPLGQKDTDELIAWFKTLPLFLEFDCFRVIHACWDETAIMQAKPYLNTDNTIHERYLARSATQGTSFFNCIERLLKGVEVRLPPPHSFQDKDGKIRHSIRVKWWAGRDAGYQQLAFGYGVGKKSFPDTPVLNSADIPFYDSTRKPVFLGHYWLTGTPALQQSNVCCVDYSAGKGGKLVSYSLKNPTGSSHLNAMNFTFSD